MPHNSGKQLRAVTVKGMGNRPPGSVEFLRQIPVFKHRVVAGELHGQDSEPYFGGGWPLIFGLVFGKIRLLVNHFTTFWIVHADTRGNEVL